MDSKLKLGSVLAFGLALASAGPVPAAAGVFDLMPRFERGRAFPLSQDIVEAANKNKQKHKHKQKPHKKPVPQTTPNPCHLPGQSICDNRPPVVAHEPVHRPGGICIGGRVVKQRCRCPANEVRAVTGEGIFLCRKGGKATVAKVASSAAVRNGGSAQAASAAAEAFAPNEVLLAFPLGNAAQIEDQIAANYSLEILQRADFSLLGRRIIRCRISGNRPVNSVLAALQGDARIAASQPNYYFRRQATGQGASTGSLQYALEKLGIDAAHAVATGLGALIAVIDTGIDQTHPDLAATVAERFDATERKQPVADPHGTAIAGIITAHGAIEGVAPGAKLLDVRVFDMGTGGASPIASTMTLLRGLQWSADKGVRIVNLSLAGTRDTLLGEAIAAMISKDIVIVAAAGNEGAAAPSAYPAAFADVIAVTATDSGDGLYAAANHGNYIALAAPGVDVLAPSLFEAYQMNSGTSFAAAHVSGVIALMLQRNPKLTVQEIRKALQAGAKDLGPPGNDDQFGAGRVNALAVLQ